MDERDRDERARTPQPSQRAVFPNCPNKLFQFHHQPFNYYANYAPGTPARTAHLRDEQEFLQLAPLVEPDV